MGTMRTDEELDEAYKKIQKPGETMIDLQKRLLREGGYGHFLKYSILQELISELEKGGFEKPVLEDMLKAVRYLFYGFNLESTGILKQDIESFGLTNSCIRLAQFNIVKQSKWYRHQTWILLEKYFEAGRELALRKISENRQKLEEELSGFPNEIIALFMIILDSQEYRPYTYEYPGVSRSYFFNIPFGSILENNKNILSTLDKVANKLLKLDLGIQMTSYVSTRGGELREPYFVTCEEVITELNKILNKRTKVDNYRDLLANELRKYKVYNFLREWMNTVLYKKDASLEDFKDLLEKNKISFENLKEELRDYEKKELIKFNTIEEFPPMVYKEGLEKSFREIMKSIKDSISESFTSD